MSLTLEVGNTIIPENQIVTKLIKGKDDIWYMFKESMVLPYDKNLQKKVGSDKKLDMSYFTSVMKKFIEDILPDIFPEGYYDTMKVDGSIYDIQIDPDSYCNTHQYSFNLDFCRTEDPTIPTVQEKYKDININTNIFLTSAILDAAEDDPITNGFFPRTKGENILPVKGVEVRTTYTRLELPSLLSDTGENSVHNSYMSIPILKTLLTETPLFFPNLDSNSIKRSSVKYYGGVPALSLKNSEQETIAKAREFRDTLSLFLIEHRKELNEIAEEFLDSKRKAGDSVGSVINGLGKRVFV